MKFKSLAILISIMLLLVCSLVIRARIRAQETSIIAIDGSVFSDDGATLVPDGWNVNVTNNTQGISQASITGDAGSGKYSVTFLTLDTEAIVAATGDEIEIVITDTDGNEYSLTYILTDEDIDTNTTTIDFVVTKVRDDVPRLDVNDDGHVDISDLVLIGRHFGETIEPSVSHNPDVNRDGTVDINDLFLIGGYSPQPTEIVVVETGNPQVPIIAIHESGSQVAVLVDETQNKLQGVVFVSENGEKFIVWVGEDGLPIQALVNGYVIIYENYTSDSVDIAIISPEGEVEVFRNVSRSPLQPQAYRAMMRRRRITVIFLRVM